MGAKQVKWKKIFWILSLVVIGILGATGEPIDQKDDQKS